MSIIDLSILECLDDCWEPVTPEQLGKLESDLGMQLPDDYQQFLLKYNAGNWRDRAMFIPPDPTDEWDMTTLGLSTGLVPEDEWRLQDIGTVREDLIAAFPGEFSETLIPIMHTLGGLICIEGDPERYGQIVERSSSVDVNNEFVIRYLAESFSEFMHGLRRA